VLHCSTSKRTGTKTKDKPYYKEARHNRISAFNQKKISHKNDIIHNHTQQIAHNLNPKMANAYIVEFAVFRTVDESTIKSRAEAAAKVAGLVAQYGGHKIENTNDSVHVTGELPFCCARGRLISRMRTRSRP
jgi:hypothetical protein